MRKIIVIALSLFTTSAFCQDKVPVDSVSKHIGEKVTVCAKVFGTRFLDQSQMTFLNLGAAYPASPLTIVIFGKDRGNFKEAPETTYANKEICVTGVLKDYNGKPEIVVSKPEEISAR